MVTSMLATKDECWLAHELTPNRLEPRLHVPCAVTERSVFERVYEVTSLFHRLVSRAAPSVRCEERRRRMGPEDE
jgi:hypothetical protein